MTLSKTSKTLTEEHKHIIKVAEALSNECNKLDSGKPIDRAFFSAAIEFIRGYADKFHHAKEEDILFKEMCSDKVEMHCNPTEQMLYEHDIGRGFVKGMEEALNRGDRAKLAENARNYAQLIKDHIYKEDNILYPMADETLDKKTQESMLKRFAEAEKKLKPQETKFLKFVKGLK